MTTKETTEQAHQVWKLKKKLLAILAGAPMDVQAVALADAVALQIANKQHATDPTQTDALRLTLLKQHIDQVVKLIPVNEGILREAKKAKAN